MTKVNQRKNTPTVINWFKGIPNKGNSPFIKFDIAEFYPSISENLLDKAIAYARSKTAVTNDVIAIIKHSRKSLLFDQNNTWIKKGTNPMFDVAMGSHDGAEICEFVGLYLLDKLSTIIKKDSVGLYRDDGLAVIENANGPLLDRLRKKIIALFKDEELSITIETNLSVTDFLDVTLDLSRGKYYPYRKPNDKPLYINASSNHPPTILKQLPRMINRRISDLSCTQEEFEKAKSTYETALRNNGYDAALQCEGNSHPRRNRNRKRKILWFNPPYNQQVQTNIGKHFIRLVKKHFPRDHKLHRIFNTNTIKLSYCCTINMANIIKQHNSRILSASPTEQSRMCNCRVKSECPNQMHCIQSGSRG